MDSYEVSGRKVTVEMNKWRESAVGLGLIFGTAAGMIISLLFDFTVAYGIVVGSIIGYLIGLVISISAMKQ
ncbi:MULTISPECIES: hypothetical protein [unclassified Exiguobacterium]|uniref:hypothetical protein n=1 Tax=unclassified Exiguobacterium TaxID=2644629 RepID=UPI0013154CBC|nr:MULTISPECIES: hypothetical protein [unclassified Exiguobacterium]